MNIKQIQSFVAVADTKSFSEAAQLMYTSVSQISKMVKSFEDELGHLPAKELHEPTPFPAPRKVFILTQDHGGEQARRYPKKSTITNAKMTNFRAFQYL